MKEMWNQRYAQEVFVYGTEPNEFFKTQLSLLPKGKVLLPAEGEGRNAAYAASKGWDVVAFDNSTSGKEKAEKLMNQKNVQFDYLIESFEEFEYEASSFDVIALIYAHTFNRKSNHQKILRFLKPGGILLLEGFSKKQINYSSGGPRNQNMLFSGEELKSDFPNCTTIELEETETELKEGPLHIGKASIIRAIMRK